MGQFAFKPWGGERERERERSRIVKRDFLFAPSTVSIPPPAGYAVPSFLFLLAKKEEEGQASGQREVEWKVLLPTSR